MKKKTVFFLYLVVTLFTFNSIYAQGQNIKMMVTDIKSSTGQIFLNVYNDDKSYKDDKPLRQLKFEKAGLKNGKLEVSMVLEPGVYGITMVDDENKNGKIDKNMLGIPKEGFGFSNFFMEKMKRPSFDDFQVEVKKGTNNLINVKVKYM